MSRLSKATKLKTVDGYAIGELIEVNEVTSELIKNEDVIEVQQLEFVFGVENSKNKVSLIRLWTGKIVNFEPDIADEELNKLTLLLKRVGLIESEDIDVNEIDNKLNGLIGKKFRFKLIPVKNKSNLKGIDVNSIEVM